MQLRGQLLKVIGSADRAPIEHVAVFNSSRERSAITDSLGIIDISIFHISDSLIFQHPSYITQHHTMKELSGTGIVLLDRKNILIDEYVISASKSKESKLIIPYMVDVMENDALRENTGLTAADILEETGNIIVQRTQGGGGSPILRGFEANKILLVIDGVRMNNAIYRSGHLQNSITIDPSILDRTEIIFGPSSIMYGSDALGGVIHYYTMDPPLSKENLARFETGAYARYSSAQRGKTGHLHFSLGNKHLGSLTSITYKDLGNIRTGSRRSPDLGDWGQLLHYVDRVNGVDSIFTNENPLIQKNTGYSQMDILQKFRFAPSQYVDWILNLQYSTSSDIDRLDKLNDYKGDQLKYASYYYGPQDRLLISLKNVLKNDNRMFTNMTTIAAFQNLDEDRYSRKYQETDLLTQQEDVNVFSLNLDLFKLWSADHKLNYGLEFNHNRVTSLAWYENIENGNTVPAQTRYPDGGSDTWNASAYASYKWILNKQFVLSGGSRYNRAGLTSRFNSGLLPFDHIDISNGALTGNLGLIYSPSDKWQTRTLISTGFRNPNVDDYGKIRAKDGFITVPNKELGPEYTYNAEVGISRIVEESIKIDLVGYYTYLVDAIVRTEYQLDGMDSLIYDGDPYRITTNYNAGRAYIYGAGITYIANLNKHILLRGALNYTRGQNLTDDVPLGHIPPIFGRTLLAYRNNRFFLQTYVIYQGWKRTEDFSPFGEDNENEAMAYGFPSWWTANVKTGFQTGDHLDFMLAIENIFDKFYKPYASGISAPGRNFILTARFTL